MDVKDKIIALLNLSRRNNSPLEAASAKKQAEALMEKNGLTLKDLEAPKVYPPSDSYFTESLIRLIRLQALLDEEMALEKANNIKIRNFVLEVVGCVIIFVIALLVAKFK